MLVFKHIQNRFYFSKTNNFMLQKLTSEHNQTPASKYVIPEKVQTRGEGAVQVVEDIVFEKNPGVF